MRFLLVPAALVAFAAPVRAQSSANILVTAGPSYAVAQGDIANYVNQAYGFAVHVTTRATHTLGLRADADLLTFNTQTRERPFGGTAGGPPVSITTGSRTVMLTAGPELHLGSGRLGAALGAGAGAAWFTNTGAVAGLGDSTRFQRGDTYAAMTWAVRGGATGSLRIGPPGGARLQAGVQYVLAGPTPYLTEEHLPVGIISGIYLYPSQLKPSYLAAMIGISMGL